MIATEIPPQIFDRHMLIRHRERAVLNNNIPDFMLHYVADDFKERLDLVRRRFSTTLCLSAATGVVCKMLRERPSTNVVISSELSLPLTRLLPKPAVVLDEESLPLKAAGFDLLVSALTLQFVNDLPGTLIQIRQALKPDGLFLGAILGGVTLNELRQATLEAETELYGGVSPRIAPFADLRDIGSLLQRADFALPVTDSQTITVTYASPLHLMRELKAMGASNVLIDRRSIPATRGFLMRIAEIYTNRFSEKNGRIRATFEILTMTGWAPHESQQVPLKPGSAQSRLADALGVVEKSSLE